MKLHKFTITAALSVATLFLAGCSDFLDITPPSKIPPENYFKDASQLEAYALEMYPRVLPDCSGNSYNVYGADQNTDNQIRADVYPERFDDDTWKVPQSGGGWGFEVIYRCNFFFANVLPKFGEDLSGSQNTIEGDLGTIRHIIGEMYVLRALQYFTHYKAFGDYPIITEPLTDDMVVLTNAAKRSPRNEVARFILSDLDKGISMMSDKNLGTLRINRDVAMLIKSRVALYEGTWLKYFKGTAFVPNGEGWPGKEKDYNANYQYPSGSIDNEIDWFLEQAMISAKDIAEKYKGTLTQNTGILQQDENETPNPYFNMYTEEDLSSFNEVMLWRRYSYPQKTHGTAIAGQTANGNVGVTRSFVQNFLMADGTPVYTHGSYQDGDGYYMGDKTIADVRVNRDSRLSLFLQEPGQLNMFGEQTSVGEYYNTPQPDVLGVRAGRYPTGYVLRKATPFDQAHYVGANTAFNGLPIYRSVEALLNYMEASFERNGSIDGTAAEYWSIIRKRAHVDEDYTKTIAMTDMNKEAENDWGAYSAGTIINSTLYNIRRERRCEFIAEGMRYDDLCRWRAMDQLMSKPYIPEGIHFWNVANKDNILEAWPTGKIVSDGTANSNISPAEQSEYLRPYQKYPSQRLFNGFGWHMAHYLEPIAIKQLLLTSPDGATISESTIYQNPYWPTEPNIPATK